jgi:hypothetical protein
MTQADRRGTLNTLAPVALSQATLMPWSDISLLDLCTTSGVTLADCARLRITKEAVLDTLDTQLDLCMLDNAGAPDRTQSVRDRLFDALMARFDALENNRAAWQSILHFGERDPIQELSRRARRARTGAWALEASGITASSVGGAGRAIGIARILRHCETVWLQDGPDLAKTMARLDQELRKGEDIAARVNEACRFMASFSGKRAAKPSFGGAFEDRAAD